MPNPTLPQLPDVGERSAPGSDGDQSRGFAIRRLGRDGAGIPERHRRRVTVSRERVPQPELRRRATAAGAISQVPSVGRPRQVVW